MEEGKELSALERLAKTLETLISELTVERQSDLSVYLSQRMLEDSGEDFSACWDIILGCLDNGKASFADMETWSLRKIGENLLACTAAGQAAFDSGDVESARLWHTLTSAMTICLGRYLFDGRIDPSEPSEAF